jgi:hypothetical protein
VRRRRKQARAGVKLIRRVCVVVCGEVVLASVGLFYSSVQPATLNYINK